jgi:hypothetical protein
MTEETQEHPPVSWLRATLSAAIIVVVGIAALVYGPNAVMTKFHGKTHGSLVAVATTLFFVVLFVMAWGLRQLQRRKLI